MTQDDVLFGYRLQLFDYAARTNVSHACRTFGVHRSTYYRWKRQVDASGLEMLRPRERRRPQMPNAFPRIVEERILAFAIANPGLASMQAAAHPATVDYLYFVRKKDKVHHFFTADPDEFNRYLAENGYGPSG